MEQGADPLLVGLETVDQVLLETPHTVTEESRAVEEVLDHDWLEHIELKVTLRAGKGDGSLVTKDLAAEHGQRLALGGVHLARHDGGAGLVLGKVELTQTATRAGTEEANVLGNLEERGGQCVELTVSLDDGVVGGQSLELVGGSDELMASQLADLGRNVLGEPLEGVETGADGGSTLGKVAQTGESRLDAEDAVLELSNVSGELLAQSKGSGVLKVSSANLDNLVKGIDLGLHGVLEAAESGDKLLLELKNSSNVHGGGEGVVGRSRHVDMVVGVDGLLGALGAAQHLDGAVGDDLVGVHVGLGAGARLPDDQRKVVEQLERCNLGGGFLDGLANFGVFGGRMLSQPVCLSLYSPCPG